MAPKVSINGPGVSIARRNPHVQADHLGRGGVKLLHHGVLQVVGPMIRFPVKASLMTLRQFGGLGLQLARRCAGLCVRK